MHSRRRRLARDRLLELDDRRTVLHLCLGNVCRSPYSEAGLRARTDGGVSAHESAGFIGPGRPPDPTALAVARARGVDHGTHRSRLLTRELLAKADVVFVFDGLHIRRLAREFPGHGAPVFLLGDFDPTWSGKRTIADPWGKPLEVFQATFDRIDRCLDEVAAILETDRPPSAR